MLIQNSKKEIGTEIDCGIHGRFHDEHRVTIRKISDNKWTAFKYPFRTKKEEILKRGDLREIVDYVNKNFGYEDIAAD